MAHMLSMPAGQFGHPMAFVILMKTHHRLQHWTRHQSDLDINTT
jgi:hypothetical protein